VEEEIIQIKKRRRAHLSARGAALSMQIENEKDLPLLPSTLVEASIGGSLRASVSLGSRSMNLFVLRLSPDRSQGSGLGLLRAGFRASAILMTARQ
jgi:hypothetical protein